MGTDCEAIGPKLSAYVDGELPEAEVAAVEAHLEACGACRGLVEQFREMDGLYGELACEEPTEGRWKQMLWNVLPRSEVPNEGIGPLTAGPRRIPMVISDERKPRWAGWTAGVLAMAGMVLLGVFIFFGQPDGSSGNGAGPGEVVSLAEDNTCRLVEVDSTVGDGTYEVNVQFPADSGDLLAIDIALVDDGTGEI